MGRACIISAITLLLSGCALPIGLQMASFAIQGISLAATDKTVTDHGISAIAHQDCVLLRGLAGDPVCREHDTIEIAIGVAAGDATADGMAESGDAAAEPEPMWQ